MESEVTVCLGCGRIVGAGDGWGCTCPPPSIVPKSSTRDPYRMAPQAAPCPRCGARLAEASFHDVDVLDCTGCQGLFIDRRTIEKLGTEEGKALRVAFPKRDRFREEGPVRYIQCPQCHRPMNRTVFGRVSGVIVDVCKDHGVWFDAGEINAVIEFVEKGGMERAKAHDRDAHDRENAKLREEWRTEHARATPQVTHFAYGHHHYENDLLRSLYDLLY